jgi:hypothetical protein
LAAVGVGAKKTLPMAAAINWILKDGLGRLGRLSVAARFGQSFDADLKVRAPALVAEPVALIQAVCAWEVYLLKLLP